MILKVIVLILLKIIFLYFKKWNIGLVDRLNKPVYDKEIFIKNGIKHVDMYFLDGSTPNVEIMDNFIHMCEKEKKAIAVHCKA